MTERNQPDPGENSRTDKAIPDRTAEWFVPRFGPPRFRSLVGALFLPYTGMVLSFSVIGSALANPIHYDRVLAIVLIYFLGLGIAAHALDAIGSRGRKPWGAILTANQLWLASLASLALAYAIALYYIICFVPLLSIIAVAEGFFVFTYNLESFQGRFHTDGWFAFSWGFLPGLAGYIIQTNRISIAALAVSASMGLFGFIEINASRPYRDLRKQWAILHDEQRALMTRFEIILKSISFGVMLLGAGLLLGRMLG
jgi:hypothetical protein